MLPITEVQYRYSYGSILWILLLSRIASEILNNFVWHRANYLWSLCALACIGALFWPLLTTASRHEGNFLVDYIPILAYLFFLLTRIKFYNVYSLKCFFSEFIVWFCFIFSIEIFSRDTHSARRVRTSVIWLVKIIVLIGVGQFALFIMRGGSLNPIVLFESRSVYGIFAHQNIFLVTILPFLFYFIKQRSYLWIVLTMLTCVATGTRSAFLGAICIFLLILKSTLKRPIKRIDIGVSFIIIIIVYSIMISMNSQIIEYDNYHSRFNMASLQWRIDYWRNFLVINHDFSSWFGHGVGSADLFGSSSTESLINPHNDYLRIYYDTGLLGLFLFLNLLFFMLRLLLRSTTVDNDFVLLAYIVIITCYFTDNLIYFTHSLWLYMFIASFIISPSVHTEKKRSQQEM
jgi:O-antigen ligase